jgi:hypothetical protein
VVFAERIRMPLTETPGGVLPDAALPGLGGIGVIPSEACHPPFWRRADLGVERLWNIKVPRPGYPSPGVRVRAKR